MSSPGTAKLVTSETSAKRLPPNPRRRKIPPEQRKRVVRACNSCNVRRIKCSGNLPCSQCASSNRSCEYPSERRKVTIPEDTYVELQDQCTLLQRCLEDIEPSEEKRQALLSKWAKASSATPTSPEPAGDLDDGEQQEKKWDGRILQDPDGFVRYMGESSGAAFMDRLREFVATVLPLLSDRNGIPTIEDMFTSLLGRYHTHDSRPLILPDVDPFFLPPAQHIAKLLTVFRFYAQDGGGFACGGIYYWGDLWELEQYAQRYEQSPDSNNDGRMLANLNVVMALACQFDPSLAPAWETQAGLTYFARAKLLLINPMEDASLVSMRILCLMGQYLLGIYRRDAAYLYIGLAGRSAVIYGLHKGWMIEGQGEAGEQNKRNFWNTYILDRWLSCLMGRPPMIPEDAVDVNMPVDYLGSNLPSGAGLQAHVELSKIMDEIVNRVYGKDGVTRVVSEIIPKVQATIQKLSLWAAELPLSLQLRQDSSMDRACLMLHMMYNQLIILCTRPLLFLAAKQAVATKYIPMEKKRPSISYSAQAKACTEAARQNCHLNRQLLQSNQAAVFATLDYHYAFTAAIVLQLGRLVPETNEDDDSEKIGSLSGFLTKIGDRGNESAKDCARMVLELGAVVSRLLSSQAVQEVAMTPSDGIRNNLILPAISGKVAYMPTQDMVLNAGQNQTGDAPFIDLDAPPQNQMAVYQELFSWFHENTF